MGLPLMSRIGVAAAAAGVSLALLLPAQAQFWDWGNRPQRQQQYNNNWGGWGGGGWFDRRYEPYRQDREAPADYSRAPASSQKKPDATSSIVVMGDGNADWLAYGLEDAFSENPEIAIVRKHRTDSGLIRYDSRPDLECPQPPRALIAAEKPTFIAIFIALKIGSKDRQTIREKPPAAPRPSTAKPNAQATPPAPSAAAPTPPPPDPEQQPPAPAEAAEHANMTPEQARHASYGPWEFHS